MQDDLKRENTAIFPLSISRIADTNIEEVNKKERKCFSNNKVYDNPFFLKFITFECK